MLQVSTMSFSNSALFIDYILIKLKTLGTDTTEKHKFSNNLGPIPINKKINLFFCIGMPCFGPICCFCHKKFD